MNNGLLYCRAENQSSHFCYFLHFHFVFLSILWSITFSYQTSEKLFIFGIKHWDGWIDDLRFYVLSTLCQLYQEDGLVIMK